jgi:hypothetical protein
LNDSDTYDNRLRGSAVLGNPENDFKPQKGWKTMTKEQQKELAEVFAEVAKELGMSRRELFGKIISGTGGPPSHGDN